MSMVKCLTTPIACKQEATKL